MKIWLITDTHFGHDKMPLYCGRPEDFSEMILENLKVIKDGDLLIHLGDICIGRDDYWHKRLMGQGSYMRWLVRGNHDGKSNTWYMNHGWDFVCSKFQDRYFGKNIMFSHVPVHYTEVVETLYGMGSFDLNIHGHFHNTLHRLQEGKFVTDTEEERNIVDLKNITDRHKLLAVEHTDYKPVLLEAFINSPETL